MFFEYGTKMMLTYKNNTIVLESSMSIRSKVETPSRRIISLQHLILPKPPALHRIQGDPLTESVIQHPNFRLITTENFVINASKKLIIKNLRFKINKSFDFFGTAFSAVDQFYFIRMNGE